MAATEVTICNLALSRIGDGASVSSIDPPDGTEQSTACSRFYPIALSSCLDSHNWSFATRRVAVPELAEGSVAKGVWKHAYGLPANLKRVIDLLDNGHLDSNTHKHEFEVVGADFGLVLLTDVVNPVVRYVCDDPKPSQFTGLFTDALAWCLASYLAGETIRGDSAFTYAQNCDRAFQATLVRAIKQDASQTHVKRRHTAPWIARR